MTAAALVKRVKVETEQLGAELLGDGHRRVLKDLVSLLSSLQTGDTQSPRVVVLEGASGSGKSRIVRELYRRLRAGEPSPGYWPELPEEWSVTKAGVDPIPNRKRLGPRSTALFGIQIRCLASLGGYSTAIACNMVTWSM